MTNLKSFEGQLVQVAWVGAILAYRKVPKAERTREHWNLILDVWEDIGTPPWPFTNR